MGKDYLVFIHLVIPFASMIIVNSKHEISYFMNYCTTIEICIPQSNFLK